jgi:hypothetical protein
MMKNGAQLIHDLEYVLVNYHLWDDHHWKKSLGWNHTAVRIVVSKQWWK